MQKEEEEEELARKGRILAGFKPHRLKLRSGYE
jgi:hypothetical protein